MNAKKRLIESQRDQTQVEIGILCMLHVLEDTPFSCVIHSSLFLLHMWALCVNMLQHFTQAPHSTLLYIIACET